jgi:tetratricopeptide (TPR) repeat protein
VITSVEDARRLAREGDRLLDRESFEEAAQAYAGAIALEPMYLMAHYGLGRARRGQKDYAAATAAFEQARRVFEKRTAILPPRLTVALGSAYFGSGRIADARDQITLARKSGAKVPTSRSPYRPSPPPDLSWTELPSHVRHSRPWLSRTGDRG